MSRDKYKKDSKLKQYIGNLKRNGILLNVFGFIPLIWAILLVMLFAWGIMVALAEPAWYLDNNTSFLVKEFTFNNFVQAIQKFKQQISDGSGIRWVGFLEMFWNSCWYSIGGTFMKIATTVCFAYAVARFEFRGRKFLYGFILLQMMLPLYGQTAGNYALLSKLGLVDNYGFLLALGAGHGMYFMILYAFFRNLPKGYEEAAEIDGADPFTIFAKVMLPMSKPIITALTIMTFISYWNDYEGVIIYLKSYPTLSSVLYTIRELAFTLGLSTPEYFAGILISVSPVAILFITFNKQIMENVTIGGLKG